MKRRGFTLLELLIVIGLIAILGGLLIIGVGKLQTMSKRQQTQLIFHNLQGMYAEYDAVRRLPFGMGSLNINTVTAVQGQTILDAIYLSCPGNVSPSGADRTGNAVEHTRDFMAQLLAMPNNASAVGKLGSGATMIFAGVNQTVPPPVAWVYTNTYNVYDRVLDIASPPNLYSRTQVYLDTSGNLLQDGQANFATPADPAYTVNQPPNNSYWIPALVVPSSGATLPTPVLLDAWNNPIVFVMGGVLGARPTGAATSGFLVAGGANFQVNSPDYRPFWASAGPDGDFSKGDDNLYSFEK